MSQLDKNLIILRERSLNLKAIEGTTLVILTHKKFNWLSDEISHWIKVIEVRIDNQ